MVINDLQPSHMETTHACGVYRAIHLTRFHFDIAELIILSGVYMRNHEHL